MQKYGIRTKKQPGTKGGAAFLQKGLAKNRKTAAAGMRKPFLLPSRYRARKKLNGRTKNVHTPCTGYSMPMHVGAAI